MNKFMYLIVFIIIWLNSCGTIKSSGAYAAVSYDGLFTDNYHQVYFKTFYRGIVENGTTYYKESEGSIKNITKEVYTKAKSLHYEEPNSATTKSDIKTYIHSLIEYNGFEDVITQYLYDKNLTIIDNKFLVLLIKDNRSQSEGHPQKYKLLLVSKSSDNYDIKDIQLPLIKDSSIETKRYLRPNSITIKNKHIDIIYKFQQK